VRGELTAPVMSEALSGPARKHVLSRGWGFYLLVAAVLVALVSPRDIARVSSSEDTSRVVSSETSQVVPSDWLIAAALFVFAFAALAYRIPLRAYFVLPVILMLVGSVLAIPNSVSVTTSVMTLVKDAYLYFWFLVLVILMRPRGDLRAVRQAWLWTSVLISLYVVIQTVGRPGFSPGDLINRERGRAVGTFSNPNMFVDYLMFSIFIALGFMEQIRWRYLAPAVMLLLLAVVMTKSNGGLISVIAGLGCWAATLAWARGMQPLRVAGGLALGLAIVIFTVWSIGEWGVGRQLAGGGAVQSVVGTLSHSSESREHIWRRLVESFERSPLGIGPGGSADQMLSIGQRERAGSFIAKEAHDDYLAYVVERGPLGILGLLLCIGQVFAMVLGSRRRLSDLVGSPRVGAVLWAAFLGALVGTCVHSLVIEKLHFRHFWLYLAILTAMTARESASERTATARMHRRVPGPAGAAGAVPEPQG
jgi:O-antigen ligase